jgi:hypothetical protein
MWYVLRLYRTTRAAAQVARDTHKQQQQQQLQLADNAASTNTAT